MIPPARLSERALHLAAPTNLPPVTEWRPNSLKNLDCAPREAGAVQPVEDLRQEGEEPKPPQSSDGWTSLVVPGRRRNKAVMSGGGGRGGKGARAQRWQTMGDAPGAEPDQASSPRRPPADRRRGATLRPRPRRDLCGGTEQSLSLPRPDSGAIDLSGRVASMGTGLAAGSNGGR